MEFKEFVRLQEAENITTGVRATKDSGDTYKKKSSVFDGKFNPNAHQKLISPLTKKFKEFFDDMRGNKNISAVIEKLGLNQDSGARSLATLYARILEDSMVDRNGNRLALNDPNSAKLFRNRLQTQIGEKVSLFFPILFLMGYDLLQGKNARTMDKKGLVNFVKGLQGITNIANLGNPDTDMKTVYKSVEDFDKNLDQYLDSDARLQLKEWEREQVSSRLNGIVNAAKDGTLPVDNILYLSPEEYNALYFPDAMDSENANPEFMELKKAMFDSIKKAEASDENPFVRGTETDDIVKKMAKFVFSYPGDDKEDMINAFVDAIIAGSRGSRVGMPAEVINGIADATSADFAREIKHKVDTIAGDANTLDPEGPKKPGGGESKQTLDKLKGTQATGDEFSSDDVQSLKDALMDMNSVRSIGSIFKKYANKKITKDVYNNLLSFVNGELTDKFPNLPIGNITGRLAAMTEGAQQHKTFIESFLDRI